MVSELLYAGKQLSEIAGYSTNQIQNVLGLDRDESGRLMRRPEGTPRWVKTDSKGMRVVPTSAAVPSMEVAIRLIAKRTGRDPDKAWQLFLTNNPKLRRNERRSSVRPGLRPRYQQGKGGTR
ncbi:MAG: hypothetical protein KGL39_25615 [Patescibacteria group bacterium]|nr:hypothetical protein [Patescibacteria group bacterium]